MPDLLPLSERACFCGTGEIFECCCQPLLQGKVFAESAEQLMRSRYSAYATGNIDYLLNTWDESQRASLDVDAIRDWANRSQWLGLQILTCERGLAGDESGRVEFVASFKNSEGLQLHRENSQFVNRQGRWYFLTD